MGVFEGKALYFCGVGYFPIQWVVVFRENIILYVVILLQNAVLWVSFVQMGSCGLLRFKYIEKWEKKTNYSNSLEGGLPEKKWDVGGGVDW